jgi:hypothetical protein
MYQSAPTNASTIAAQPCGDLGVIWGHWHVQSTPSRRRNYRLKQCPSRLRQDRSGKKICQLNRYTSCARPPHSAA